MNAKNLSRHIGMIIGATGDALPVTSCILFNSGHITSTDLNIQMTSKIDLDLTALVPAKPLYEVTRAIGDVDVTMEVKKGKLIIKSATGNFSLSTLDVNDFPKSREFSEVVATIGADHLITAIDRTAFAMGADELRPQFNGIHLIINKGEARFEATDSHRLSIFNTQGSGGIDIIIPSRVVNMLRGILTSFSSDVEILETETAGMLRFDTCEVAFQKIDAKYPKIDPIIPKESTRSVKINREMLSKSLKRVSIFADTVTHTVKVNANGEKVRLMAENQSFNNEADETLSATHTGEEITIGFNSKYLQDAVNNSEGEMLTIEMTNPDKPAVIHSADALMLVMPVMVNG